MNRVGRYEENQGTAGLQTKLDETGHSRTLQCRYQLAEKAERSDDSAANWAVNWNWERGILTGCRTGPYNLKLFKKTKGLYTSQLYNSYCAGVTPSLLDGAVDNAV